MERESVKGQSGERGGVRLTATKKTAPMRIFSRMPNSAARAGHLLLSPSLKTMQTSHVTSFVCWLGVRFEGSIFAWMKGTAKKTQAKMTRILRTMLRH